MGRRATYARLGAHSALCEVEPAASSSPRRTAVDDTVSPFAPQAVRSLPGTVWYQVPGTVPVRLHVGCEIAEVGRGDAPVGQQSLHSLLM